MPDNIFTRQGRRVTGLAGEIGWVITEDRERVYDPDAFLQMTGRTPEYYGRALTGAQAPVAERPETRMPELEQPEAYVYDYATNQFVRSTLAEVEAREQFYNLYPEIAPPGTPGKVTPQQYFGTTFQENPRAFVADLYSRTSVANAEDVLRTLQVPEDNIKKISQFVQTSGLREQMIAETIQPIFPGMTYDEFAFMVEEDPDKFWEVMQTPGNGQGKAALLSSLGATQDEIDQIVAPEYQAEGWLKDNIIDPLLVGGMNFLQGAKTFGESILPALAGGRLIGRRKAPGIFGTEAYAQEEQWLRENVIQPAQARFFTQMDANEEWLRSNSQLVPKPEYQLDPFKNTYLFKDPGYWANTITSSLVYSLTTMGTIIGVTALTGAPPAGVAAGMVVAGAPESADMTEELVRQGIPFEEAVQWGSIYGGIAGGIESVSDLPLIGIVLQPIKKATKPIFDTMLKFTANRVVKAVVTGAIVGPGIEGMEEAVTQAAHNAILKHYDESQSILEGVDEAFIKGAMAALPFGILGGVASYKSFYNNLSSDTRVELDTKIDDFTRAGATEEQAQVMAANEIAKTPDGEHEISRAIEETSREKAPAVEAPTISAVGVPSVDITQGVIKRGKELVANPDNIPAAKAFVVELRRQADVAEQTAQASTPSKAKRLMQNARAARRDADRIEATIPEVPGARPYPMSSAERRKAVLESRIRRGETVPEKLLQEFPELREVIEATPTPTEPSLEVGTQPPSPPPPPSNDIPLNTDPAPLNPTPGQKNIIGLRPITSGLTKTEIAGNWLKRMVNVIGRTMGFRQMIEAEPSANAAMRERARVMVTVDSQANAFSAKWATRLNQLFTFDKKGGITSLAGVDPNIPGAPTIQDVAARLPNYEKSLSSEQLSALRELRDEIAPYKQLMEELGIEIPSRPDVMEGGFYLPRGRAQLEGMDAPVKVGGGRRGVRKGFERPAYFDSQAAGIEAGYEYADIGSVLANYVFDSGNRSVNTYVATYFKTLTDENGKLLGETTKDRMLRQNPEIRSKWQALNYTLNKLRRNIGVLTERELDVIDSWQNDPAFDDIDMLHDRLDAVVLKRGEYKGASRTELVALLEQTKDEIKALRPDYKVALRRAQVTPRDQGVIILPELAGRTYPNEIANAVNKVLKTEGETIGRLSPVVNVINAYNNFYRGVRATLDDSVIGIQGLLGMYGDPKAYALAFKVHIGSWAKEDVLGAWVRDFDDSRGNAGRLTTGEWAKYGLHFAGREGTEFSLGIGNKLGQLPGIREANRAFSNFGDVLRTTWADHELETQLHKRSLEAIKESGDIDRIANIANNMTGWSTKKAFGSMGELVLFAPRFLQARLETVTKAAMGLRPNAAIDQRIARNSMIKMISFGVVLTVLANAMLGQETDFNPLRKDKDDRWRRNSKFMRIKLGGHYYSLFGTWDSLLGLFLNLGTGRPELAARSMASGIVANAWDLITGRDYNYKAVKDTPAHFAQWLLSGFVPFGISQAGAGFTQMWGGIIEGDISNVVQGGINVSAELFGVKSYPEEDWNTLIQKLGTYEYDDPTLLSTENPVYTWRDFVNDAADKTRSYPFQDVLTSTDYPVQVRAAAQTLIYKEEYNSKRSWTLLSLNADPEKGDTYRDYYRQWLKDPENEKAKYGNMTQTEYALLEQYHSFNNEDLKKEFLEKHPEINTVEKKEWLKANPEANAYLAMAGYADILSKEAYTRVKALMQELDIPESALLERSLPPETSLETHWQYMDMVAEEKHGSWEAQLLLLKDAEVAKEAGVESYADWAGLTLSETPIEALEIKVKNRMYYDEYDALETDEEREAYRLSHVEWMEDKERVEAIEKEGSQYQEQWVERWRLAQEFGDNSSEAKLWLLDNPDVYRWAIEQELLVDRLEELKFQEPVLRINVDYKTQDAEYEALTTRDERQAYLESHMDYYQARYRRQAYQTNVPEEYHEEYIEWYTADKLSKPADWSETTFQDRWHEDDWWLMEHRDFYENVYLKILKNEPKDFSKVPTRRIFQKWLEYNAIRNNQAARDQYRLDNPDLDNWGVSVGIWSSTMSERRKRLEQTPLERFKDYLEQSLKEFEEELGLG